MCRGRISSRSFGIHSSTIRRASIEASSSSPLQIHSASRHNSTASRTRQPFCTTRSLSLPLIAAAVLMKLQKATGSTHVMSSVAHIVPLLVLAVDVERRIHEPGQHEHSDSRRWRHLRHPARMADRQRHGPRRTLVAARRSVRACVWVGAVIGLGLTVFSINGLAHSARTLRDTGFTSGPAGVAERAGAVWRSLGRHPSAFIDEEEQPGLLKIAGYVRACTEPGDRLFVLGVYPELYYFADRPLQGATRGYCPCTTRDIDDEARIVARLKAARVPIVLTEDRSPYDREYRTVFEQVDKYLQDHYVDVGEIDIGGAPPLRALTRCRHCRQRPV